MAGARTSWRSGRRGAPARWAGRALLAALSICATPPPAAAEALPVLVDSAPTPAPPLVPAAQIEAVLTLVEREYVRAVPAATLAELRRHRQLQLLDRHSSYLDPAALDAFDRDLKGGFGGIGVMLDPKPAAGGFRIDAPILGSPALAAGLRADDVIVRVEGRATQGWTIDEIASRLMGTPGTAVAVEVQRAGLAAPLALNLVRATITPSTVRGVRVDATGRRHYLLAPQGVAYLRITAFAETTVADLDAAFTAIDALGARALVLDLRGNIGGLAGAAIAAADRLIDVGRIVQFRDRHSRQDRAATPGMRLTLPLAVLIDGETLSSAELLAAALQDHGRAIVVGARSFGKGTVQKIFRLDGGGAIKLTIADYLRPSGAVIERHGVGGDAERGGVWPDPGCAVFASEAQWQQWRQRLSDDDVRANFVLDPPLPSPLDHDPVVARALELLRP